MYPVRAHAPRHSSNSNSTTALHPNLPSALLQSVGFVLLEPSGAVAAPRRLARRGVALRGSVAGRCVAGRSAARREGAHSERDERRKGDEEYAGALRLVDGDREQHVMAPHGVP